MTFDEWYTEQTGIAPDWENDKEHYTLAELSSAFDAGQQNCNCIHTDNSVVIEELQKQIEKMKRTSVVWHDLRKDPTDLPPEGYEYLVVVDYHTGYHPVNILMYEFDEEYGSINWVDNEADEYDAIAWCEIPRFEES